MAGIVTAMNAVPDVIHPQTGSGFVDGLQHRLLRQFKVQAADWQDTCRELANWEDGYLVEARSPERLAEHALLVLLERSYCLRCSMTSLKSIRIRREACRPEFTQLFQALLTDAVS